MKGTFPSNSGRPKRASISLGSYLLGEGETISSIAGSLSETIKKYNENFVKVKQLDSELVGSYNILMSKIEDF